MKKLLIVISVLLMLVACGEEAPPNPPPEPTVEASTDTEVSTPNETEEIEGAVTTDSGLQYIEVSAGEGPKAQVGQVVAVHYTGKLEDGTVFDDSYSRGEPIQFPLGQGYVIPGWDEGIALMNVGTKAQLIIPPELGYGENGAGTSIPPNATLIFDVELVSIQEGSPAAPTEVDEADYESMDNGLKYYDFEVGTGDTATAGQTVLVDYTGWLTDGTKFDSSLDRGEAFSFRLGAGDVIEGWDEGVAGMQVGGKRQLVIPSELGYGEGGAGGVIPPNATLIFEVELLEVE